MSFGKVVDSFREYFMFKGMNTSRAVVVKVPEFYLDYDALKGGDPYYKSAVKDLVDILDRHGGDAIVVDLRGTSDGMLLELKRTAGFFVGKKPLFQMREKDGKAEAVVVDNKSPYWGRIVVLVDEATAAYAEMFAAAIQDTGSGIVVGRATKGQGILTSVERVANGSLTLPVSEAMHVNGKPIQHNGVVPDILVNLPGHPAYPRLKQKDVKNSIMPSTVEAIAVDNITLPVDVAKLRAMSEKRQNEIAKGVKRKGRISDASDDPELEETLEIVLDWIAQDDRHKGS